MKEKLLYSLEDTAWPKLEITHDRQIARAIIMNDDNKVCVLHVYGDDAFGHRDYYETPGGGIDLGETPEVAVVREIDEEIGYKSEIITYLGTVSDYYNLINRHNINNYFLCKVTEKTHVHFASEGDKLIESVKWVSIDEAISLYENLSDEGISGLVKRRELPIFKLAKEFLERK